MHALNSRVCLRHLLVFVAFAGISAATAGAQPADPESPGLERALAPGSTVWITDASGREHKTRILEVAGGVVTASIGEDVRQLRAADVREVRVRHFDSVLNGALIGAGSMIGTGLFLCRAMEPWEICNDPGPIIKMGAAGAGIGAAVDALFNGRRTVYTTRGGTRFQAVPLVGRGAAGLQVAVRF